MHRVVRSLAFVSLLAMIVGGCSADLPAGAELGVDNGTTLEVRIVVNGTQVASVPAAQQEFVESSALPDLPWRIQALSPTGRVLLEMHVESGVVWSTTAPDGHSESHSAGARVDLSCGRLDLYVGAPMLGPMPGPGVPGDCEP